MMRIFFSKREDGQATVEFALILPVLLMVMFAVFEFGHALWAYQQLTAGANEGARVAIISRSASDRDSKIENAVKNAAPGLEGGDISVTTSSSWTVGSSVTVTASYPEEVKIMGVTFFDGNLEAKTSMRVQQ